MLLLTSSSDQLQVITDAASAIDVHASWVDIVPSTAAISPGRANTAITTATTTSVAGAALPVSPATQRNVKALHIRNKHALNFCTVTVQLIAGAVTSQLYSVLLKPGGMLQMTDMGGFRLGQS